MRNRNLIFFADLAVLFLIFINSQPNYAKDFSLTQLNKLAIMENGRIKPLDTYAQNILKQFSGRSKFGKEPAIKWLARALFNPKASYDDRIFLITNPEVLDSVRIQRYGQTRNRYSFSQMREGWPKLCELAKKILDIPVKERSFIEKEILMLWYKLILYQQLSASFDFSIKNSQTYKILQFFSNNKEFNFKKLPMTILPPAVVTSGDRDQWYSPWDLIIICYERQVPPPQELSLLQNMALSYQTGESEKFEMITGQFNNLISSKEPNINISALLWEVIYNQIDPFYKSKVLYGFTVIFILLSFVFLQKIFYRFSFLLLTAGFFLNLFGVLLRMYIRQRPPVTNLYETFIFTGLMVALLGIILELSKRKNIGILTGASAGFIMFLIAGKYALEGDTMGMLVAVLDSNFWLASHVISIILGYSGILLSGFLGHVYIVQKIVRPAGQKKNDLLKSTYQALYSIQAFGLIFTLLGTVLGGIWADQSWGRFWGWDPKENGALVILLWSASLFHAKLSKWIKEAGMAFGSIIGVIAVALAWFGVNLLGMGLHSYGFILGVANSLFIFIGFEVLFIIIGAFLLRGTNIQK